MSPVKERHARAKVVLAQRALDEQRARERAEAVDAARQRRYDEVSSRIDMLVVRLRRLRIDGASPSAIAFAEKLLYETYEERCNVFVLRAQDLVGR